MRAAMLLLAVLLAGCGEGPHPADGAAKPEPAGASAEGNDAASGAPGDNGSAAEPTPSAEGDAEGAKAVAEAYFEAIAAGRFGEAWRLLGEDGRPDGASEAAFAAAFADYAEYQAKLGTPGRVEGAAGSLWVEVPVRVRGRMRDGATLDKRGAVVLRRCNAVPGCTPEQRRWRIEAENIGLE